MKRRQFLFWSNTCSRREIRATGDFILLAHIESPPPSIHPHGNIGSNPRPSEDPPCDPEQCGQFAFHTRDAEQARNVGEFEFYINVALRAKIGSQQGPKMPCDGCVVAGKIPQVAVGQPLCSPSVHSLYLPDPLEQGGATNAGIGAGMGGSFGSYPVRQYSNHANDSLHHLEPSGAYLASIGPC